MRRRGGSQDGGRVICSDGVFTGGTIVRNDGWRREVVGRMLKNG